MACTALGLERLPPAVAFFYDLHSLADAGGEVLGEGVNALAIGGLVHLEPIDEVLHDTGLHAGTRRRTDTESQFDARQIDDRLQISWQLFFSASEN